MTGAICVVSCALIEGTEVEAPANHRYENGDDIRIWRPFGYVDVRLTKYGAGPELIAERAGVVVHCAQNYGEKMFVPAQVWLSDGG